MFSSITWADADSCQSVVAGHDEATEQGDRIHLTQNFSNEIHTIDTRGGMINCMRSNNMICKWHTKLAAVFVITSRATGSLHTASLN